MREAIRVDRVGILELPLKIPGSHLSHLTKFGRISSECHPGGLTGAKLPSRIVNSRQKPRKNKTKHTT